MRQTSIDTYYAIKDEGVLGDLQWKVYDYLYHHGPMTGRELDDAMIKAGAEHATSHKRLPELERCDAVRITQQRACKISGRVSREWDVTDRVAVKQPKPESKAVRYRKVLLSMADYMEHKHDLGEFTSAAVAQHIRKLVEDIE
jgi:hypothetical protein